VTRNSQEVCLSGGFRNRIAPNSHVLPRFDQWAPLGPMIVSSKVYYLVSHSCLPSKLIPNPNELILQTRINGDLRQDTNTNDMLFDVKTLVSFCSQGTTLEAGSIIMTGTPEGNTMFSSSND
jgi:2-keto-4-pentenoate hydratase/2-oxohepta-3-ene-1,7-dioic acid hydratase in catechol pathway